ncbi:hypothetical protein V866_003752 [Kwoniella sp. B9012]|uniref:Mitochondrial adapter protein MCP1 transmembrane domain-containing protein n=1 Tax=Kwoniella europaea PYCC6329 TaxID=1423913 RepID=A0AAX4KK09_9TREE
MSPPPPDIPLPHQIALNENQDGSSSYPFFSDPKRFLPSKGQVIRVLTLTQNTSAMVFGIFLVPHLASPVVASAMGIEGADKTMMISRDLYLPLEPYLIYLPLTLHILASTLKRLLIILPSSSFKSNWPLSFKSIKSRLPRQLHQIVGYPLTILLIAHILSHRLIPSRSESPISELSPSELGYEYVGYNLQNVLGWTSYLGLVGLGVYHGVVGSRKISSWFGGSSKRKIMKEESTDKNKIKITSNEKKEINGDETIIIVNHPTDSSTPSSKSSKSQITALRALTVALVGIITVGLYRIKRDVDVYGVSQIMKIRYDAVHSSVPWAGIWR